RRLTLGHGIKPEWAWLFSAAEIRSALCIRIQFNNLPALGQYQDELKSAITPSSYKSACCGLAQQPGGE
ncbi:MAG TPA: hypothetical protein PKG66_01230, partial [Methanothrix sp.]|nr:hypothetical protein [Methanothrix sp.]